MPAEAVRLPGVPRSVGIARRFVADFLARVNRPEWQEAAIWVTSLLVTNAVLHAHTSVELIIQVFDDHARIEVRDFSTTPPSPRSYSSQATTGRGLELVAAAALAYGAEHLGDGGKVVWCTVGDSRSEDDLSVDDLLAAWEDQSPDAAAGAPGAVGVVLRKLPPTLWFAAREHHDALLRELALMRTKADGVGPAWFGWDAVAADAARFAISHAVDVEVERARRAGTAVVPLPEHHPGDLPPVPATVDLQLFVTHQEAAAFAQLQDALDEGEQLARAGLLLMRPGLAEIVAVRDWACEQVIAQVAGSPPTPWTGADDQRFADDVEPHDRQAWDGAWVADANFGVIAVDDANRIIAVSQPLCEVLGWTFDALVGRRVVAIVPPRFREAHVAGFSRHLSTGVARALDVDLHLPVLCADGSEIDCHFRISAAKTEAGRNVYLARISPATNPSQPSLD
jgi:PAS domain S-box-containing protein